MEEEKKKRIIQILVIVVTVIIFSLWLLNMKYFFHNQAPAKENKGVNEVKKEFFDSLDKVRETLGNIDTNEIKNAVEVKEKKATTTQTTTKENTKTSSDNTQNTISGEVSIPENSNPGSGVSIPENNNSGEINTGACPAWINCMPSIGETPRDCTIPKGCEGITQIAY